ncbi:transporter [Fretibacter rubidus]|uniref:EamA family transporter n=1 Tax=Fretibacter rubidus TaxID=570162 RepID=UPI00352B8FFB
MKSVSFTGLSPAVAALLIATPIMIAGGQVLFKMTSERLLARGDAAFASVMFDPVFIAALALYGGATLLWIFVLKSVPLSFAYSFMALTFVIVPLLAAVFLKETIGLRYMIGSALIMAGLIVVQN